MVTFFFVLSGFVISISYIGRNVTAGEFLVNRLCRIAPIYWIALVLFLISTGRTFQSTGVFLSASFLQTWIPKYALTENVPGWSISVEMFFYVLSPILLVLANAKITSPVKKWFIGGMIFWIGSQIVLAQLNKAPFYTGFPSVSHALINYFPVSHLCSFILGFAGGFAYKHKTLASVVSDKMAAVLFLVSVIVTSYAIANTGHIYKISGVSFAYGSSFFAVFFLPIIYFCALGDKVLAKVMAAPLLILAGEASYSFYILQKPVNVLFSKFTSQIAFSNSDAKFISYFAILFVVSILTYLFIEKPLSSSLKKAYKRFTTNPAPAGRTALNPE